MRFTVGMHRVGSAGNNANAARPRKERRLTYVLRDSNDAKVGSIALLPFTKRVFRILSARMWLLRIKPSLPHIQPQESRSSRRELQSTSRVCHRQLCNQI